MTKLLLFIGGILVGAGITLSVYSNYFDTGTRCLNMQIEPEGIAACVDILNGG